MSSSDVPANCTVSDFGDNSDTSTLQRLYALLFRQRVRNRRRCQQVRCRVSGLLDAGLGRDLRDERCFLAGPWRFFVFVAILRELQRCENSSFSLKRGKACQVSVDTSGALETSQRVLIIDPEQATRSSLADTLRAGGLEVDVCDGLGGGRAART